MGWSISFVANSVFALRLSSTMIFSIAARSSIHNEDDKTCDKCRTECLHTERTEPCASPRSVTEPSATMYVRAGNRAH